MDVRSRTIAPKFRGSSKPAQSPIIRDLCASASHTSELLDVTDMVVPWFVLWKWTQPGYRTPYLAEHVNTVVRMMLKHQVPVEKIICVCDDPTGITECRTYPIWPDYSDLMNVSGKQLPSCYRRLKIFDPATLLDMGVNLGDRVVSMDLDVVIMQNFLPLFQRSEPFVGWKVPGTRHRIVMNGSMFLHTAGEYEWLWKGFDPNKSPQMAAQAGYMGSDQGYLSHQLVSMRSTGGWFPGEHGVLSFMRDVVRQRLLPKHTRMVFFPGKHKPWMPEVQKGANWILRYLPEPIGSVAA